MITRAGAFIFVSSLLGVGCFVGGDDVESNDPNPNGVVCSDAFKLTGTWTAAAPLRDPVATPTGCWPVGTWTFTATRDPSSENVLDITGDQQPDRCGEVAKTTAASADGTFSFTVNRVDDGDGWVESYVLNGATQQNGQWVLGDKVLYKLKVTEGGAGQCEGSLELLSSDRTQLWNFKPDLTEPTISGSGSFTLYDEAKD